MPPPAVRLAHGSCGAPSAPRQPRRFEQAGFRLSSAKPFSWRRNLFPPPLVADRTVFNYVAAYNDFERRFAQFLDTVPDDLRFASLGTTEQGESGTLFHIDYLKPRGAIGFYYPEWVAVQMTRQGEVNWVIETKGRVWEDTTAKDTAHARLVRSHLTTDGPALERVEFAKELPVHGCCR